MSGVPVLLRFAAKFSPGISCLPAAPFLTLADTVGDAALNDIARAVLRLSR